MKSQINILRQLQELVLTRDEHHQTGDGSHLDALNDSIDVLQQKLEPQVASVYGRLYKKNHIVMLREDMDGIRELADSGNPYMQYTYARLHDVLLPQPDSVETFEKYYTLAMESGIADAKMQLAFAYRDGDFGELFGLELGDCLHAKALQQVQ